MPEGAPLYPIEPREVYAVEHPMVIKNVDKALATFGHNQPWERIFRGEDPEGCVPLYLRPNDPMSHPILSHHTATTDVLLKITVPKKTGRKRKRGSREPFQGDVDVSTQSGTPKLLVKPSTILRTLRENSGKYKVEAVGEISHTHRFRTLPDFHHSATNTEFFKRFQPTVLSGDFSKLREFKLNSDMGFKINQDHVPPPTLSTYGLPFNWGWHQNGDLLAQEDSTGNTLLVNKGRGEPIKIQYLIADAEKIPTFYEDEYPDDPEQINVVKQLEIAFRERPIWTRRALKNRFAALSYSHLIRYNIQYVAYTFRGGPWRDALIKMGIDPRTDPKYRIYQTVVFKIYQESATKPSRRLRVCREKTVGSNLYHPTSHLFDGESFVLDGKVWQLCDLTDPLLARLVKRSTLREECDILHDGWYNNGAMAKIKGIMRTKLDAVQLQKVMTEEDFKHTLAVPDHVVDKEFSHNVTVQLPLVWSNGEIVQKLMEQGAAAPREGGIRKRISHKSRNERLVPFFKEAKRRRESTAPWRGSAIPEDDEVEEDEEEGAQQGDEVENAQDVDIVEDDEEDRLVVDPGGGSAKPKFGAVEVGDDEEDDDFDPFDDEEEQGDGVEEGAEEEDEEEDGGRGIREEGVIEDDDDEIIYPTFSR